MSEEKSIRVIKLEQMQALGLVKGKPSLEEVLNKTSEAGYAPIAIFPCNVVVKGEIGAFIVAVMANMEVVSKELDVAESETGADVNPPEAPHIAVGG